MRRKFLISLTVVLSLIAVTLFAIPLGGCAKEEELPVWKLSETVTASFSDNGKYGYILTVDGTGDMPNYQSKSDTPWYGKSGRVTDISVSDGITSIGDNAFTCCYYAKTVILPASVTKVGSNAFPAGTKVYCYATAVTAEEGAAVYAYSESKPTSGGNFWHSVNGTPVAWPYVVTSHQKILFIGNSYTYYNEMPTMFAELVNGAGTDVTVTVEAITTGSQSLKNWADASTEDGARVEAALAESSDYDIIVLQEKSTSPVNNDYNHFVSGATALAEKIKATQDNCRIFLYETWGSPAYAGSYGGTIPAMEARLRTAYDTVAEKIGATVSYVGKAFTYMYENRADINLYNTADNSHPTYEGSYLAACVHAASLLGLNVENSTYYGTLDVDTADYLREVGYAIAVGADISEITYDMQIAVYGRYADATVISKLVAAFRADYAAKNSVEAPNIKYSMLGASNTAVAAFGEIVNAGSYDMILGAGNNINTSGGVSVIAKKSYDVVDSVYPTGGTRYVCRLTENELAVALYGFMDTDEAKVILDPNYVPEVINEITLNFVVDGSSYGTPVVLSSASGAGAQALPELPEKENHNPMGWALTAEEAEGETLYSGTVTYATFESVAADGEVTLYARYVGDDTTVITVNIAVFKRYINENTVISLISAFKETYSVNEGEVLNVTYELLGDNSTGAADFGGLVNAGTFNIAFGSGNNVDSTGGVAIVAKKSVYVADYSGDRTVAYLTADDATKAFYDYFDTDAAKKILNPAYISQDEADTITINLIVNGSPYGEAIVVSNATEAKKETLPTITPEEGQTFLGWSENETEVDGETYLTGDIAYADVENLATSGSLTLYARFSAEPQKVMLKVAVYKKFIDQLVVDALKVAFEKYCQDNSIDYDELQFDLITTGNGAAFTSDAKDYDVAIGHKAGTSFVAKESLTVSMMMNEANGGTVAADRKAERLTDSNIAQEFMLFLKTDEGKAALIATAEE